MQDPIATALDPTKCNQFECFDILANAANESVTRTAEGAFGIYSGAMCHLNLPHLAAAHVSQHPHFHPIFLRNLISSRGQLRNNPTNVSSISVHQNKKYKSQKFCEILKMCLKVCYS